MHLLLLGWVLGTEGTHQGSGMGFLCSRGSCQLQMWGRWGGLHSPLRGGSPQTSTANGNVGEDMMIWCFAQFPLDGRIDYCQARASSEEDESSSSDDEASPGEDYGKSDSKDRQRIRRCRVAVDAVGGVRHVMCSSEKADVLSARTRKQVAGTWRSASRHQTALQRVTTSYIMLGIMWQGPAILQNLHLKFRMLPAYWTRLNHIFSWFYRYFQMFMCHFNITWKFSPARRASQRSSALCGWPQLQPDGYQMVIRWSFLQSWS